MSNWYPAWVDVAAALKVYVPGDCEVSKVLEVPSPSLSHPVGEPPCSTYESLEILSQGLVCGAPECIFASGTSRSTSRLTVESPDDCDTVPFISSKAPVWLAAWQIPAANSSGAAQQTIRTRYFMFTSPFQIKLGVATGRRSVPLRKPL